MIFLGNCASRHLQTWRSLYALRGQAVDQLFTIHPTLGQYKTERHLKIGGKLTSYGLLGLWLRRRKADDLLHAHGASGYGFAALVSGRPYVVTVYGSELLAKQGKFYSALVRKVLQAARIITVTSPAAKNRIIQIDPELADKILCFHTGIDLTQLKAVAYFRTPVRSPAPIRLMCIRNCAPHYRTREILTVLKSLAPSLPEFSLTVPLGNGDRAYFNQLRAEFPEPWINYVDDILPYEQFLTLLINADICINFPVSDQTSATLIEALYFNRTIITNNLDAYAKLLIETADYGGWRIAPDASALSQKLSDAIHSVSSADHGDWGMQFVTSQYGLNAAAAHLDPILECMRW